MEYGARCMAARGDVGRSDRFAAKTGDAWPTVAAAALILSTALPLRAEVHYREQVETFEIGIRDGTPEDIWTAIRRYGPLVQGKHAVGSASGQLNWSDLSIARRGGDCRLERHTVGVTVVMTLPEWWRAGRAPDDQRTYWQCIERTVTVHERRHAEIWRETAHAIDRALGRLDDWTPCNELRAAISTTANRLYQEGASRQRAFDDEDGRRRRYQQCPTPAAAADARTRASPTTSGRLGERDRETEAENAAKENPLAELGAAAATILAIIVAVAGYATALVAVMALANRRTRLPGRPEAD